MRIHTGERPFVCTYKGCGSKFITRGHLNDHARTHTNDRPYVCNVCGHKFMRSTTLKVHLRTHSGERPYVCTFPGCDRSFTESGNLNTHMKTHNQPKVTDKRTKGKRAKIKEVEDIKKNTAISAFSRYKIDDQANVPSSLLPKMDNLSVPQKLKLPLVDIDQAPTPRNNPSRDITPMNNIPQPVTSPHGFVKMSPINCQNIISYQMPYNVPMGSPINPLYQVSSPFNQSQGYNDFSAAMNDPGVNVPLGSPNLLPGASPSQRFFYGGQMDSVMPMKFYGYGVKK